MAAVLVRSGWNTGVLRPVFALNPTDPTPAMQPGGVATTTLDPIRRRVCLRSISELHPRQAERPGTTRSSRSPQALKIDATCFSSRAPLGQALMHAGSPSQKLHFIP